MNSESFATLPVTDAGCGIPKEFINQLLFRPFKTTKNQGMGIGLFHTKKIIETHQGRIEVRWSPRHRDRAGEGLPPRSNEAGRVARSVFLSTDSFGLERRGSFLRTLGN